MTRFLVLLLLAQGPQASLGRAAADFENGRFAESAAAFDSLATADPDQAPYLWQLGACLSNTNTLRVGRLRRRKTQ